MGRTTQHDRPTHAASASSAEPATFDAVLECSRQALYRFMALILADPCPATWESLERLRDNSLLEQAAEWIRRALQRGNSSAAGVPSDAPALDELEPQALLARLPDTLEALRQEHVATFGLLAANACPAYEIEYMPEKFAFQRSNALADIAGFYHAFGLQVSSQHPDRPDHVALELEFMAFLIGLARQAASGPDELRAERIGVCRDAQRRFLQEHLGWWTPAFARLLQRESRGAYYAQAGRFLAAWIAADHALLGLPRPTPPPRPQTIEPPEACAGCG